MRQAYIEKSFHAGTEKLIILANSIIDEYMNQGDVMTLRQLYYQLVSRDHIPNNIKSYKRLVKVMTDARMAGWTDWDAIEDRSRNLVSNYHNEDPGQAVEDALEQYMLDRWKNQPFRPEVWIEKEALLGVIRPVCRKLDVPCFACKGYTSQSEMRAAALRLHYYRNRGQNPVIIHLGDHDPSGIDMTRDIEERQEIFNGGVEVLRIALNEDQIAAYNPPPNPAKLTDTRAPGYIKKYGDKSWELDALKPGVIRKLIEDTVAVYRDDEIMAATMEEEAEGREVLEYFAKNWEEIYDAR